MPFRKTPFFSSTKHAQINTAKLSDLPNIHIQQTQVNVLIGANYDQQTSWFAFGDSNK